MNTETRRLPATYAALVFSGKDFDPELVTAIIGKNPTLSYAYGREYLTKDVVKTRTTSLWVYSTRNHVTSDTLERHLDAIEELLIGSMSTWPNLRLKKIQEFIGKRQAKLRIDVFWYGAEKAAFPKISRSFDQVVTIAGGLVATDFHRDGGTIEAA